MGDYCQSSIYVVEITFVMLTFLQVFFVMERKLNVVHRQGRVLGEGWRVSVK